MRPSTQVRILSWDLAVVLEEISLAPFEPLDSALEVSSLKNGVSAGDDVF